MNHFATVPLSMAVKAAAKDTYEDLSKVEEDYSHWAARAYKDLNNGPLRLNIRTLKVPVKDGVGRLPCDCQEPISVHFIDECGQRVDIPLNTDIVGPVSEQEECCPKCGMQKGVCELLERIETKKNVTWEGIGGTGEYPYGGSSIGGSVTEEELVITTVRYILPSGDYVERKTFPVYDAETNSISMETTQEVVAVFDMNECGCPAKSTANINLFKLSCPEAYEAYFCDCSGTCELGVKFFVEEGTFWFTKPVGFNSIYLKYRGSLPRKDGDYVIPEIALESIAAWIVESKWRNRKGVQDLYSRALLHKNSCIKKMKRYLWRDTLDDILQVALSKPRP